MRMDSLLRTGTLLRAGTMAGTLAGAIFLSNAFTADTAKAEDSGANEARVANKVDGPMAEEKTRHPLDPALRMARRGLKHIDAEINDYTATMVRRERIAGKLKPAEYSKIKVRNPHTDENGRKIPFSIYIGFEKPTAVKGRECIYIEGENQSRVCAHEGSGLVSRFTVDLDPHGTLAMNGNRYSICEAGVRNLIVKLIEKGERDRQRDECECKFFKNAKINGRKCTVMQVMHPVKRDYFDFHKVQIFIDDEYQVPIRYASWSWPAEKGGKPVLEEEYTYVNFTPNVGLKDIDFDRKNTKYNYK